MDFRDQYILINDTFAGDLQIRYYGIIIVVAMLVAATVAAQLATRRKMYADHVWGGLTWAIFPGIIGARLWFVLFPPVSFTAGCGVEGAVCKDTAWFLANFFNTDGGAIAVWTGGLSIFGAVLGGLFGAWLYCSRYHNTVAKFFYYLFSPLSFIFGLIAWVPTALFQRVRGQSVTPYRLERFTTDFPAEGIAIWPWLDIAAVALPLAQAIGRWANYVNQELYGSPTTLPWGIVIDREHRVGAFASMVEYPETTLFHPLFLYEALWSLLAFFVLLTLFQRGKLGNIALKTGDIFLLYLMQYSVIRFLLEFLRVEVAYVPGTSINSSQVFVALVFVGALVLFLRNRSTAPQPAAPAAA
ncbi:MAG: prolipoprotein diacylglyceryl transferase [Anaerolineae bacterium]|jgi:phosphatidylglycerol:prolipoprotein diacylglycerol transferase|nr:prolipoprotein diacylglyceryl transferase [Anaerolineae bacterium]